MTVNYTTLLGLAEPVTGTQSGTWGDDVNKGITDYLDIAIAGTQTISGTQTAVTLSITNGSSAASNIAQVASGATGSAQYQIINCTGGPVSLLTITAPASSKTYVVINATSTSQSVKLVAPGPTTGVTVVFGEKAFVVWNGTDFVKVTSSVVNLASGVTGILPIANGGTATATPALVAGANVTITGTWPNQTIAAASPGSGTVTAVSVVSANGLAGTSSGGATPALTLSTSVTGVLKGNGTAISAAVAGTDYVTPTGTETLTNKTIEAGTFTNGYTEETVTANTSTAYTIDLANGTVQYLTLTGNCTYTFPTPVAGKSFILVQKQDGTGSRTVTWPASVDWPGATAPTLTSTASKADKFVFTAIDGSNWLGSVAGQNYTV